MYNTSSATPPSTVWYVVILLASMVVCGALSSYVAKVKGHGAGAWFACGFFFDIFGLIAAAGLPTVKTPDAALVDGGTGVNECPDCAEVVKLKARVCPHCGHRFTIEENRTNLTHALDHRDPKVRRQAIMELPSPANAETMARLIEALKDRDDGVRAAAVDALAATGGKDAARILVDCLDQDEAGHRAYAGLEHIGKDAIPYLEQATERGTEYRRNCAEAILKGIKENKRSG